MVSRAALAQIRFILRRRSSIITFLILMAIMLSNYTVNVFTFQGYDVLDMYHPMKLLSLSYNRINYSADTVIMLVQLFPLLVCLPAGLSLAAEL